MYCNNCGSEIAEGGKFCSNCGAPVTAQTPPPISESEVLQETPVAEKETAVPEEPAARPSFAEFQWNVEDYPSRNAYEKTEDVDFNWNANPADIQDSVYGRSKSPAVSEKAAGEDSIDHEYSQS